MLQVLLELDQNIILFIQEKLRFEWLTPIMRMITMLGDNGLIWLLLAMVLLCIKKYRGTGITMSVALVIGYVIANLLLKNLIARVRPYEAIEALNTLIGPQHDWSFPSGHTTSSIAASIVLYNKMPKYIGIPAIILAVLICISRLYLGVHYPTDVLVGILIGIIASICAMNIISKRK